VLASIRTTVGTLNGRPSFLPDMHAEASLVVKAPLEITYHAYTDFESMPKWSKHASSVRILRREESRVQLEVETAPKGTAHRAVSELRLQPMESVESEGETRYTRTKRTVFFTACPEGTKVTASLDVNMKGSWGWIFRTYARAEAESSAREELASFAGYVERLRTGPLA